jgi:hypothetical protein
MESDISYYSADDSLPYLWREFFGKFTETYFPTTFLFFDARALAKCMARKRKIQTH